MYASIRRYNVNPGAMTEMVQKVEEGFAPLIRRAPGLVSYNLIQVSDHTLISISLFTDQEGAEESNRIAANWVAPNVGNLVQGLAQTIEGPVVVHCVK
ncbi:MAG: hypothetical protein JO316_16975 [Abitibacteriaceae bacterium]|nr:hypothetical protein [Abditibacteriaceae bacterium]MBV9867049.1 hypothetical protein [Abditibacteriaceae bacterium]